MTLLSVKEVIVSDAALSPFKLVFVVVVQTHGRVLYSSFTVHTVVIRGSRQQFKQKK